MCLLFRAWCIERYDLGLSPVYSQEVGVYSTYLFRFFNATDNPRNTPVFLNWIELEKLIVKIYFFTYLSDTGLARRIIQN